MFKKRDMRSLSHTSTLITKVTIHVLTARLALNVAVYNFYLTLTLNANTKQIKLRIRELYLVLNDVETYGIRVFRINKDQTNCDYFKKDESSVP